MCTAIGLKSKDGYQYFGRNMDIEYEFGQRVMLVPRGYKTINRVTNIEQKNQYAIMGMGTIMDNYPLFADGFNEHGLACAGLNFPGYASYNDVICDEKVNLAPYDIINWVLSNFISVSEVRAQIENINIVNKPFAENVPLPPLHWIISDKTGESIVIEKTNEKLAIFENKLGVLSNSPTFDWHITNLNQYTGLNSKSPEAVKWGQQELKPDGQGLGLASLPGDSYPSSRFVRASYMCKHAKFTDTKEDTLASFFHILDNLAFVDGTVITEHNLVDYTMYSSAMNLNEGIYYYKTYKNSQINAINMYSENLECEQIISFEYHSKPNINFQN